MTLGTAATSAGAPRRRIAISAFEPWKARPPISRSARSAPDAGRWRGSIQGGLGSASLALDGGIIVGALVAVNSVGSAVMPDGKTYWAWAFEIDGEFGGSAPPGAGMDLSDPVPEESRLQALGRLQSGANTTLGVVACNADLSTAECKRVAMMAHDGIARAIRPAHTPFDGDTVFALASGSLAAHSRFIAGRARGPHRIGGGR